MKNGTLETIEESMKALNKGFEKFKGGNSEGLLLMQANAHAVLFHCWIAEAKAKYAAREYNAALIKCAVVLEQYPENKECLEIVYAILKKNPALAEVLHMYDIKVKVAA